MPSKNTDSTQPQSSTQPSQPVETPSTPQPPQGQPIKPDQTLPKVLPKPSIVGVFLRSLILSIIILGSIDLIFIIPYVNLPSTSAENKGFGAGFFVFFSLALLPFLTLVVSVIYSIIIKRFSLKVLGALVFLVGLIFLVLELRLRMVSSILALIIYR